MLEGIPTVLNKILANQLDPDAVMKTLDEILHAVNPNAPVITYTCDGVRHSVGPSAQAAVEVGDVIPEYASAFHEMIQLNNSHEYSELLTHCLAQIQSTPQWLTPRLLCGLAYLGTGDVQNAKAMLFEFDTKIGPAYQVGACK